MLTYLPNFDGLTRSILRDTIRRIYKIRHLAGKENEDYTLQSTGDPFRDLLNTFINLVVRTKNDINERNQGCRDHGDDYMTIELSNRIRKDIFRMEDILAEIKQLVDEAERLLIKEKKKNRKKGKVDLLERSLKEKHQEYNDCLATLHVVREMNSERVEAGRGGINAIKETDFGKRMELRQKLLGMHWNKSEPNGNVMNRFIDPTVGGGKLEESEETKEQMKIIAEEEAKINAGLDRLREGASRLHNLAMEIGGQLSTQNEILLNTEENIVKQQQRIRGLTGRMKKMLHTQKPMNCCVNICIFFLIISVLGFILIKINLA
ncbi:unnamed protein product [Phytomonas sp. EM1]|nr:unnamed protein product [Phytomonas sp. EM1]|eukprot:CCW60848.1 unnamed protein product [Phytomonas sp. isolate EM1]